MPSESTRLEHDLLGEKAIPSDAYYGVQTARGLENFHISGVPLRHYPDFIIGLAMVKLAAARANFDCQQFGPEILAGIEGACQEIIDGKLHDQFKLDVRQGGAGTSTNMNANEVIANRANQLAGKPLGAHEPVHPNDHVNKGQSSNDGFPVVMHVAAAEAIVHRLVPEVTALRNTLDSKAAAYADVVMIGRTHLQDAVPVTLGQVIGG